MKKRLKHLGRDAMTLGVTGIGLSAASSLGGGAAVGKIAGGMGTIGGVVMAGHTMGMVGDMNKQLSKKRKRGY